MSFQDWAYERENREWTYKWNQTVGMLAYVAGLIIGICLTVVLLR